MIYHITSPEAWETAQTTGQVVADSLTSEGFIHCSRADQLLAVASRYFPGVDTLLVLAIDENGVAPWLVSEGPDGVGDAFAKDVYPHVYAPIPVAAVVMATRLPADAEGRFVWPPELPRSQVLS